MSEIAVVGSFRAKPGAERATADAFADDGEIVIDDALPGGEPAKGSLAGQAAG